ncbi:MAG: hypothetical protein ABLQ96_04095 [Candidatus Acidiferrum sp.]
MQEQNSAVPQLSWNWRLWAGFVVAIAAFVSYMTFFLKFPITRNVPWVNWLLFAFSGWLLWTGLRRAFRNPQAYRGKIAGPILALFSLALAVFFGYATLHASRRLPLSAGAPQVGTRAPEFTLTDTSGKMVSLSTLLSETMPASNGSATKPRGVVLIFYRGYW